MGNPHLIQSTSENWRSAFLHQDLKIGAVVSLVGTTFTAAIESEDEEKTPVLVGGLVAIFYFPIYWEFHHPN